IYAYVPVGKALCTVDANAVDEIRIKNKTRAVEAKAIEYNFFSVFIYFFSFILLIFKKNLLYENCLKIFKHFVGILGHARELMKTVSKRISLHFPHMQE